jgi:hypothetical protein
LSDLNRQFDCARGVAGHYIQTFWERNYLGTPEQLPIESNDALADRVGHVSGNSAVESALMVLAEIGGVEENAAGAMLVKAAATKPVWFIHEFSPPQTALLKLAFSYLDSMDTD